MQRFLLFLFFVAVMANLTFAQLASTGAYAEADPMRFKELDDLKVQIAVAQERLEQIRQSKNQAESEGDTARAQRLQQEIENRERELKVMYVKFSTVSEVLKKQKMTGVYGDSPKIVELENKSAKLGQEYQNADKTRQNAILTELEKIVNELFDLREEQKKAEIEQLQARIQELNQTLAERQNHKKEIVQRRIDELTNKGGVYSWD